MKDSLDPGKRWLALYILCIGVLMIVLDTTIVNVALPSIRADLGFTETSLVWVINAYVLTFGGFLLLGGRLGDIYGHRRLFLAGLASFTVASLVCGLAQSQEVLIAARAVQGIGGAVVDAIALSLVVNLFTEPDERAKAMGFYGFVCAGGGVVGVLIGGFLTEISWHWIFLVNIPIGIAVYIAIVRLLPSDAGAGTGRMDLGGAVTITLSLMFAVYAIVNGNEAGWLSAQTLGLLGAALLMFIAFLVIETRIDQPLVPLGLFRLRNLTMSSITGMLWSGAMFAWFFLAALYLQQVLGYDPIEVGLAFLPANIIMAACSLWWSARLVSAYGLRIPAGGGLLLATIGLALFARAPVEANVWIDVLPAMTLLGLGGGIAFNPILLAAMNDVKPEDSGLASGVLNTSFMMGGALGLAILAAAAAARTETLREAGVDALVALNEGYQLAFLIGTAFALMAALVSGFLIREAAAPAANAETAA